MCHAFEVSATGLRRKRWCNIVLFHTKDVCFLSFLSSTLTLSLGNEGVVFSHSVETSHVRAEPFQDLKYVFWMSLCLYTCLCLWWGSDILVHFTNTPCCSYFSCGRIFMKCMFSWIITKIVTPQIRKTCLLCNCYVQALAAELVN